MRQTTLRAGRRLTAMMCRNRLKKARIGGHSENFKRAIIPACVLAIVAAITFTIIQVSFLPVGVDGGLYSYPTLSLSRGADPSKSQ